MSRIDKKNDQLLLEKIRKKKKSLVKLPIYASHIVKEVKVGRGHKRYFWEIFGEEDFLEGYEDQGIPVGIFKPKLGKEIDGAFWKEIKLGVRVKDFGYKGKDLFIYEVKYYPSSREIKYIIGYEVYGGYVNIEDARSFGIYGKGGLLRRHIYVVGNQEVYERDYIYTKDRGKIRKVIEKVIMNNRLLRLNIYERLY